MGNFDGLGDWDAQGGKAAADIYADLERELNVIACAQLRNERASSLSSGDLVNEAVLRIRDMREIEWQSRPHVLAMAARTMRRVLIDQARRRHTAKRAHQRVALVTGLPADETPLELVELDMALKTLREIDKERADIVEMRFFGGMSNADIGVVLGVSEATVKRRWSTARAWLYEQLKV